MVPVQITGCYMCHTFILHYYILRGGSASNLPANHPPPTQPQDIPPRLLLEPTHITLVLRYNPVGMLRRVSAVWVFITLILPLVAAHWSRRPNHQEVAQRARGDVGIYKRQSFSNARFTYYDVGL